MKTNLLMDFSVDKPNRRITVKREFAAPVERVWAAWTQSELLDKWWAPKPWKAETKTMDFSEGGLWLYAMVSPENERHYSRADYQTISKPQGFTSVDAFCDENGNLNSDFPQMHWQTGFTDAGGATFVDIIITFESEEELEKIMAMGFKEGFTMGLSNLDELFEQERG
ncbi:MAG TPA: SRPBCC domain-containing protein [Flavobacterium sp.]|jgi:uncharacterized protein YndB with AHSA1/START domain